MTRSLSAPRSTALAGLLLLCCALASQLVASDQDPVCVGSPTDAVAVAVGDGYYLALRQDGGLWCSRGANSTPAGNGYRAIAAGYGQAWAVTQAGALVSWNIDTDRARLVHVADGPFVRVSHRAGHVYGFMGDNTTVMVSGTLPPPDDLGAVLQIEASNDWGTNMVALGVDGHVRVWGNLTDLLSPPNGLTDVAQIARGTRHVLARRNDGSVVAWGDDSYGQATVPGDLPPARWVMAGADWSAAILLDGQMVVWGGAWYGPYLPPAGLTDAVSGAGDGQWMAILRSDGTAMLVAGSPHQTPYPIAAWTHEGENAAVVVVAKRTESAPYDIPIHSQGLALVDMVTMPAGGRYATARIPTQLSTSGHDWTARIIPDPLPPTPGEFDWYRGSWLKVIGRAPVAAMNFSPERAVFLGILNDRSYLATDAAGRSWLLGSLDFPWDSRLLPPTRERVVATATNGLGESIALCSDGRVIASWRGWSTVPVTGTVRSLVQGSAQHVVCSDDSLLDLFSRTVVASNVDRAQNGLIVYRNGSVGHLSGGGLPIPDDLGPCVDACSGAGFGAAVRIDGTVRVWQQSSLNPGLVPPAGLTDVVQLASGLSHIVALRRDGTVVAWGANMGPETDVPPGLRDVIAVSATGRTSAALRSDGVVITWPISPINEPPQIPEGGRFVAVVRTREVVAADTDVTLGLHGDATLDVASSVRIPAGQAIVTVPVSAPNDGDDRTDRATVHLVDGNGYKLSDEVAWATVVVEDASPVIKVSWSPTTIVEVAAGGGMVACRRANGRISAWGTDNPSQGLMHLMQSSDGLRGLTLSDDMLLGLDASGGVHAVPISGSWHNDACNPPAGLPPIKQLAAGSQFVAAVQADGRVRIWGNWSYGQPPGGLDDIREVVASDSAILAIRNDGSVVGWGAPWSVVLPIPADLPPVAGIALSHDHAVAMLPDGTVRAWGHDAYGQLDVPPGLDRVVSIACRGSMTCAVSSDGTVVAWGMGIDGKPATSPAWLPPLTRVVGGSAFHGLTTAGTVLTWDDATESALYPHYCSEGDTMAFHVMLSGPVSQLTEVLPELSSYPNVAMSIVEPAIIPAGASYASGLATATPDQDDSQEATVSASLGSIPGISRPFGTEWPLRFRDIWVFDDEPAISLTVSPTELQAAEVMDGSSMIGLRHDGRVVAWGQSPLVPLCRNRTGLKAIAVGGEHVLFLGEDGSVTAVGSNTYGQCSVPDLLGPVRSIAAGYLFSMALLENGRVVCWGVGTNFLPMQPPDGLDQVVALAVGGGAAAVRADGSLVVWDTSYPVPELRAPVRSMYASSNNWVATLQDGTVQAWGHLDYGNLAPPDSLAQVRSTYIGQGIGTAFHDDGTCTFWGPRANLIALAEPGPLLSVSANYNAMIGLRQDGTISNIWGEAGQRNAEGIDGDTIAVRLGSDSISTTDLLIGIDWSGIAESGEITGPPDIRIPAGSISGWGTYKIGRDDNGISDTFSVLLRRGEGYGPDYWAQYPTNVWMQDDGLGAPLIAIEHDRSSTTEGTDVQLWLTTSMPFPHDTEWTIQALGSAEPEDFRLPSAPIVLPAWQLRVPCTLKTAIDTDTDDETLVLSVVDRHGVQVAPRTLTITEQSGEASSPAPRGSQGSDCGIGVGAAAILLAMGLMGWRRTPRN